MNGISATSPPATPGEARRLLKEVDWASDHRRSPHDVHHSSSGRSFCEVGNAAGSARLGDARMRGIEIAAQYFNFQTVWNDAQPEKLEMPCHLLVRKSMKRFQTICVALTLASAGTAYAQAPAAKEGPGNNAVNSDQKNSNAPVAGRNSFTEGQAQSAIEKAGYTNVTELKKDDDGVWRGKASKNGSSSAVSVDFQGNVNAAK